MKSRVLTRSITLALYGGLAGMLAQSVAIAQEEKGEELEAIIVTGSRIKRAETETAQPVFALERVDLERTGLTSVADVLTDLTSNGASIGLTVNNGNTNGTSRVDLRNCGSNRTLVLVNGRRWVPELNGNVDLSSIPFAAIERIEVLKDGASSIYGTDAICGVINITMRDKFEGAQATAYVGENSHGDGRRTAYDLTMGTSNDRGSVLFNVAYTNQEPIMAGDRDISSVPLFGFPANTSSPGRASPTTPFGSFNVPDRGVLTLDPSKPGCRPNQDCTDATGLSDFRVFNFRTDGYNFTPVNYLVQPQETQSVYTQGRYDLTDNVKLRAEMLFNQRSSEAQLAAQPLSGVRLHADNVYNPFGVTVNGVTFRPTVQPRSFAVDQDTVRYGLGLEGNFGLWDRGFNWDVNYSYSNNELVQVKRGFFDATRFGLATGPSFIDAGGVARCGTAAAPIAGCVPFNLTGGQSGITPEMLAYVGVVPRNITEQQTKNYTANLSGEIVELPAGMLAFAAGLEYRKEFGYFDPDPLTQSGNVLGDNPATATRGGYNLTEGFIELAVPVLRDVTFAKSLEFSVATRHSDYSNFGTTNNPKFGFTWRPIDDLLVRGNYAEGFRAPSINELFAGQATGFPTAVDPCSRNSTIFQENADVRARCAAAGVPTNYQQSAAQVRGTSGGNPNLSPETARTKTLGLVYSPEFVEGLNVALDWYNIQIENNISARTTQQILNDCFVSNISSRCALIFRDLDGSQFGNPGEVRQVLATNQNFASGLEVEGFDFTVDYNFSTDYGDFKVNWDNAYISYYGDLHQPDRGVRNGDGDPTLGNQIGTQLNNSSAGSLWRLQSRISTTWTQGDWSATLGANYTSALKENCSLVVNTANALGQADLRNLCSNPNRVINTYSLSGANIVARPSLQPQNEIEDVWYFDAQATWQAPWKAKITAGIRNLFDKDPPVCFSCFANNYETNYRVPGRFYYVSYQQKF
ncbi:TonB-dependent receptor plug domain-containing protein [Tahibacter amnicola]|uniref:TonB-dependent receptor n=1 Tax=Tahibacter amnicola TaxID=2976241 RepID=A0ABY6BNH2_9GAMM|nr:TonB-dependent receptor [Tahibacter amnicola]UXI69940.1 TonB-dependent receptor [Tahibacter amnicola]